ncbi:hypothetical protein DXG01_002347 [Tephrocybe rancida]|nr:hypothetical protein DXG01_002347 [Tephrocybe rancida]
MSSPSSVDDNTDFDDIFASMSNTSLPTFMDSTNTGSASTTSLHERGTYSQNTRIGTQKGSYFDEDLRDAQFEPEFGYGDTKSGRWKDKDRPIYTQRQVEDMLNMLEGCYGRWWDMLWEEEHGLVKYEIW